MSVEFHAKSAAHPLINLTPLIDVIFLLLVFFMLTSSFTYPALDLDLPKAEQQPEPGEQQRLVVSVDAQGAVYLNRSAVTQEELEERIRIALTGEPHRKVFFRGHRDISYERFVELMEVVGRAGATHFNIIHEPKAP